MKICMYIYMFSCFVNHISCIQLTLTIYLKLLNIVIRIKLNMFNLLVHVMYVALNKSVCQIYKCKVVACNGDYTPSRRASY